MQQFDAVSLGILWDRLIAIADETVEALVRTSFSSIVRENYDLACVLFDADGNSLAQGSFSQPVFIGTAPADVAPHAGAFSGGDAAAGRRRHHERRLDRHGAPLRHQRDAARCSATAGWSGFVDEHHPSARYRRRAASRPTNAEIYEEGLQIPDLQALPGR